MWTAEGKTSFDDWPMFTWSLRWTASPARFAMTSFAFMFDEVPEPVWKTSTGNCSSCSPAAIASPAAAMLSAMSESSFPRSALARAAAALMRPSALITGAGMGCPETGKFSTAFSVSEPQSCSAICPPLRVVTGRRSPAMPEAIQPAPRLRFP